MQLIFDASTWVYPVASSRSCTAGTGGPQAPPPESGTGEGLRLPPSSGSRRMKSTCQVPHHKNRLEVATLDCVGGALRKPTGVVWSRGVGCSAWGVWRGGGRFGGWELGGGVMREGGRTLGFMQRDGLHHRDGAEPQEQREDWHPVARHGLLRVRLRLLLRLWPFLNLLL